MPQMSPTWWFTLFSMFIMTYMIMMTTIYFNKSYKIKNIPQNMKIKSETLNWKW